MPPVDPTWKPKHIALLILAEINEGADRVVIGPMSPRRADSIASAARSVLKASGYIPVVATPRAPDEPESGYSQRMVAVTIPARWLFRNGIGSER